MCDLAYQSHLKITKILGIKHKKLCECGPRTKNIFE
jgi:hypothetical protein